MEPSGSSAVTNNIPSPSENHDALNSADGSCPWEVSDRAKLRRFLCYGSESNIYTAREESQPSLESAAALFSLLHDGQGCQVVEDIRRFARDGRAVAPGPCLFALAVCSQHSEQRTKQAAFRALKEVSRACPARLFAFVQYKKELREGMKCGIWGRALRRAVARWYNEQDAMSLALAVTTCRQRQGWSHQDLLRLSHTKPASESIALISKYVTKGWPEVQTAYADKENLEEVVKVLSYLEVVEKVRHSCDETEVVHLIMEHRLEREQLLTDHLKSKEVWRALLKGMPLESVLRILGKMTADKVLEPGSRDMVEVCERIQSEAALKKAKLHPFTILFASENYKRGHNCRGKVKWEPDISILKALDAAFYKSFMNVEPVGKRFAVAVDVSTSLSSVVPGTSVSTAVVAAAITMLIARTEVDTQVLAYSEGAIVPCTLTADMTLAQATIELVKIPTGMTDGTLPMTWATENQKEVDVFIVLTNNPCWSFTASPVESLRKYRQNSGIFSKMVMCGLTSIGHAIADTEDRGLLSMCGFDLGALSVIRNLAQDLI